MVLRKTNFMLCFLFWDSVLSPAFCIIASSPFEAFQPLWSLELTRHHRARILPIRRDWCSVGARQLDCTLALSERYCSDSYHLVHLLNTILVSIFWSVFFVVGVDNKLLRLLQQYPTCWLFSRFLPLMGRLRVRILLSAMKVHNSVA